VTGREALVHLARRALGQPSGTLPAVTLQVRFQHDGERPDVTEVCAYVPRGPARPLPVAALTDPERRLAAGLVSVGVELGRVQPTPDGWSALFNVA